MKTFFSFVGGILFIAVTTWFLLTYVLLSEEEKIERLIEKARYSVENGSSFSLAELLSPSYQHENGMDSSEVLASLNELYQQTKNRRIHILNTVIQVNRDEAETKVTFLFTGQTLYSPPALKSILSSDSEKSQEAWITFRREQNSWKIYRTALRSNQKSRDLQTEADLLIPHSVH